MQYSLTLHIIGLAMWLPGLMVVTGVMRYFLKAGEYSHGARLALSRRYWFALVIPGLVLSTTTGLYQLFSVGMGVYMKQGWFHGKMTLLIVLFVVTALVGLMLRSDSSPTYKKLTLLHSISGSLLLLIVALTMIGRVAAG